jgi:methyl-accepting chemotaxis protein
MNWFNDRRIAAKLMLGASSVLVILASVGGFAVLQLAKVNRSTHDVADVWLPGVRLSSLLKNDIGYCRIAVLKHVAAPTIQEMTRIEEERSGLLADLKRHLAEYQRLFNSDAEREAFQQLQAALDKYVPSEDDVIAASQNDKETANRLAVGETQRYFQEATDRLTRLIDIYVAGAEQAKADAAATYQNARLLIFSLLAVGIIFGAVQSYVLSRAISTPVRSLARVAEALANGDIEQSVEVNSKEELGDLASSFRKMQSAVRGLVEETREIAQAASQGLLEKRGDTSKFQGAYRELVQGFNESLDAAIEPVAEAADVLGRVADRDLTARVEGDYRGDHAKIKDALNTALDNLEEALRQAAVGAEQVTTAANQISHGSQSLAQGANQQASSLQEVSSSLEQMASMTRQNAENSSQGKLLAGEARRAADRGNDAMQRMAGAIDRIKTSSDATAKIVKTIDEIAFQTNLLALNAAVEAARAGEAGKGFAVVAEEVRNLAQRSAEAAKNTANMIEESVKNADGGVRITEEVAKVLSEISGASHKVNDLVTEIAAASAEQSKGIEQINRTVNQLDKVTQQNAANSEESASAAQELNSQAESLSQTVAQFRLTRAGVGKVSLATDFSRPSKYAQVAPLDAKAERQASKQVAAVGCAVQQPPAKHLLPLDEEDFQGF